jgi:two-component system, OmpR family, aerobic respiration control sensor histidine kinase ArcB
MHSKKILLVEDSPLPQMIVKTVLRQLNCLVDIATSGEDSIVLCQQNHYDLIFMDIGLPGIDGIMAAKLIREQEKHDHRVPIIALTAHDDPIIKSKALEVGMDDYLIKPLTILTAQDVLDKYCHYKNLNHYPTNRKDHNQSR